MTKYDDLLLAAVDAFGDFPYYLCNGALLGIYRDKELIPWDDDVDFYCRAEDLKKSFWTLVERFQKAGLRTAENELKAKFSFWLNDAKGGVAGYWLRDNRRIRNRFVLPRELFQGHSYIEYQNMQIRTFEHIEGFLEWAYKDWKTPCKEEDERKYNRSEFIGR